MRGAKLAVLLLLIDRGPLTAREAYWMLRGMGFTYGYATVRRALRELERMGLARPRMGLYEALVRAVPASTRRRVGGAP